MKQTDVFLPFFSPRLLMKRFTQSMRLERLSMEQGTMDEPSAQSEQADEPEKKRLTTKVQSIHHHSFPSEKHVLE